MEVLTNSIVSVDEVSIPINENEKQAIINFYKNSPFRIKGEPIKQETLQQIFKKRG